jgi:hypothetical protein
MDCFRIAKRRRTPGNKTVHALPILIAVSFVSLLPAGVAVAQPLRCKATQLLAAEDRKESDEVDGGLGHFAMTIALRNRSSAECGMAGQLVVALRGESNRALTAQFCPNCIDYLFDKQPVQRVLLKPNETAYLVLGYDIDDGAGPCRDTATVSLGLPNKAGTLKIDITQNGQAMPSCGKIDVTPFLRKPPVDGVLPRRDSAEAGK